MRFVMDVLRGGRIRLSVVYPLLTFRHSSSSVARSLSGRLLTASPLNEFNGCDEKRVETRLNVFRVSAHEFIRGPADQPGQVCAAPCRATFAPALRLDCSRL